MKKISLFFLFFLLTALPIFAQEDIKITHAPYLQNLGENEVTIVWTVNKPSIGWVELAPDDGTHYYQTERPKFFNAKNGIIYRSCCPSEGIETRHTLSLPGLFAGSPEPCGLAGNIWKCSRHLCLRKRTIGISDQ